MDRPSGPALRAKRPVSRSRDGADGRANFAEDAVGILAEDLDRDYANHDDQRQHHGILDRRGAVFLLQEINQSLANSGEHGNLLQKE